jgi:tetratricopeptide (TPR) repeat protein
VHTAVAALIPTIVVLLAGLATALERKDVPLAGGARQAHTVVLRSGDALRGSVEQRGIDVVVTVRRPGGGVVLEVDSPNGTEGPEPIAIVARAAGTYAIEVSALEPDAAPGHYDLRLDGPRPATPGDREVAEALDLHLRAFTVRNEALALMGQALYRRSSARYAEAERGAQRALALRERVLGPGHYDVAATHQVLGLVYDELGDYARGERHFARALQILEGLLGPGHPGLLTTQSDLGYLRLATGDYAGAETLFTRALTRREEIYGRESERLLAGLGGLAEALLKQGQPGRAEAVARRVLSIGEAVKRPSAGSHTSLGLILIAQGRASEAEAACQQARTAAESSRPAGRTSLASALLCLGQARAAAGDPAGAEPLLAESVRIREAAYGPDHPTLAEALTAQGRLLALRGEARQARDVLSRALRIRERRLGPAHPAVAETREALSGLDK